VRLTDVSVHTMARDSQGFASEFFSDDASEPLPQWVRNVKLPWNFGPRWWLFLHSLCLLLGDEPTEAQSAQWQQKIYDFVEDIPCKSCRGHAQQYVEAFPPDMQTQRSLFTWSWRFHNAVNQRLGKPLVSFDAALRLCANPVVLQSGIYAPNVPRAAGEEADARLTEEEHVHQEEHAKRAFSVKHEDDEEESDARLAAGAPASAAYAAPRPKLGAMRTFWNSRWGAVEWLLVALACFGITSLLFCLVRAMRADGNTNSNRNHATGSLARHGTSDVDTDATSPGAGAASSVRSQSRVERGNVRKR
jgi:hypothetical protein